MKNVILFILIFLIGCNSLKKKSATNMDSILEITFQEFFNNDKLSLKLNEFEIFENIFVSSNKTSKITNLTVKAFNDNVLISNRQVKKIYLKFSLKNNLVIKTFLNDKQEIFEIDLTKGKYIGFDKKIDELYLLQSKTPFEYD